MQNVLIRNFLILWIGLVLYFVLSIVGRRKRKIPEILALNIFLGWTVIGWVSALVWALTKDEPAIGD